jgi:hypothetical protein
LGGRLVFSVDIAKVDVVAVFALPQLVEDDSGYLEHHDSPDLDHWLEKQNRYTPLRPS